MKSRAKFGKYLVGFAAVVLVILGVASFYTYYERSKLVAMFDERSKQDSYPLRQAWQDGALANSLAGDFLKVEVTGQFFGDRQLFVVGRSVDGTAGLRAVAPFVTDFGKVMLIDRGFLKSSARAEVERLYTGQIFPRTIKGVVRFVYPPAFFIPDNNPQEDDWFSWDLPVMGEALGIAESDLLGAYLMIERDEFPNYPIGGQWRSELTNDAWSGGVIFFSLAIILLLIYRFRRILSSNTQGS